MYQYDGTQITYNCQAYSLPHRKKLNPYLAQVHSQVLQDVARRIDKAYKSFFRRVKSGETPGYPRFKGKGQYNSFTYPQSGYSIEDGRLKLSCIGSIKIKLHRDDLIAHEKLEIKNMVKNRHLSKSISDAGWGIFFRILSYKAESAGREVIEVNPHNTSQICNECGNTVPKTLNERWHCCPVCGCSIHRDVNAARNILKRAIA